MKTETLRKYLGHISLDSLLDSLDVDADPRDSSVHRIQEQCHKGFAAKVEVELSHPETQEEANVLFQDVHSNARPAVKLLRIVLEPL
jgi:hypothetical protein